MGALVALVRKAEEEINHQLFRSWHRIKTSPETVQAERRGVENLRLRIERLLTDGE